MSTNSHCCVTIDPLKLTDSEEIIRAAITFSPLLPPLGYTLDNTSERLEISYLSRALGWSDPRGLYGYTKNSEYKDLYAYFDYGDKSSPVNELVTNAFKMYGLGGVQERPTWGNIRGSVVITRMEPDLGFSPNLAYNPNLTIEEMYQTLVFFRDSKDCAYDIAIRRDSVRFMKNRGSLFLARGKNAFYNAPNGSRTYTEIVRDMRQCNKCNKSQSIVGELRRCTVCKVTLYCSKECQKADWRRHKIECRALQVT
mmetsp:Transcript_19880/g.26417  ORF Transcript_19880/g.26417 Transcript_19880/m.26417 type:complete len:254 (-) Transcript_19880:304-1065(-)